MESVISFFRLYNEYLVLSILVVFGLIELLAGHFAKNKRTTGDYIQEFFSFLLLSVFTKPLIVVLVVYLGNNFFPSSSSLLNAMPFYFQLPLFLLVDDVMQYWYHRSAHAYLFLWKLHRAHHASTEMGLLVSYRNAALYYALMPNIWWLALFTFWGGGSAVVVGLVLKQLVIIGAHSTTKWDQWLYRFAWLSPLAWVVERTIVTPAFHFAHHGVSQVDEISEPNGNFGNMFAFWDILFGSAYFTRQYPEKFGIQTDTHDAWYTQLFFPVLKSENRNSPLASEFNVTATKVDAPTIVDLAQGNYLWCQCGLSKTQPFCDGSHHGTKHKPLLFKLEKQQKCTLCNCKRTKNAPFCDGAHKLFTEEGR